MAHRRCHVQDGAAVREDRVLTPGVPTDQCCAWDGVEIDLVGIKERVDCGVVPVLHRLHQLDHDGVHGILACALRPADRRLRVVLEKFNGDRNQAYGALRTEALYMRNYKKTHSHTLITQFLFT